MNSGDDLENRLREVGRDDARRGWDADIAWPHLRARAAQTQVRQVHRPRFRWAIAPAALAAAVTLWLSVRDNRPTSDTVHQTAANERRHLLLPDSSTVDLAPRTTLRVPGTFSAADRVLELRGTAFFDVRKEPAPFLVRAGDWSVRVLGTRFGVRLASGADTLEVTVVEGVVRVSDTSVPAGMTGRFVKGQEPGLATAGDSSSALAWLQGRLRFQSRALDQVRRELAWWFDLDIDLSPPALGARSVTGELRLDSADDALAALAAALDLAITRSGRHVTLSAKPSR